jgi:hypothetical protein
VSQKELGNASHEGGEPNPQLHKMKAGIQVIVDFEGLKAITELVKRLVKPK